MTAGTDGANTRSTNARLSEECATVIAFELTGAEPARFRQNAINNCERSYTLRIEICCMCDKVKIVTPTEASGRAGKVVGGMVTSEQSVHSITALNIGPEAHLV